jgi:CheY-like chemotaxis protein
MVLDLMMSGMSGFDVVKFVGKKIPVIVLTALSDEITKENCIRDGV